MIEIHIDGCSLRVDFNRVDISNRNISQSAPAILPAGVFDLLVEAYLGVRNAQLKKQLEKKC